uniref:Uncharacterized protein n=1 Tax=Leersia perrieri TaxID=77586 RepID=A0A0D9VLI0_9ORYZ
MEKGKAVRLIHGRISSSEAQERRCGMYDDVPRTAGGSDCWEDTHAHLLLLCQELRRRLAAAAKNKKDGMLITGSNYAQRLQSG